MENCAVLRIKPREKPKIIDQSVFVDRTITNYDDMNQSMNFHLNSNRGKRKVSGIN